MSKFLFFTVSYICKAYNPTILNLSIDLKKISLELLDYRAKLFM